jgi:hypothetical protein
MKNIHVLPTDKPSRLQKFINYVVDKIEFELCSKAEFFNKGQHIYITSDEEIKKGDWFIENGVNINKWKMSYSFPSEMNDINKKVILTTDPDLIADGVQAIDDEFLEWFVKNPSCEEVEVDKGYRGVNLFNYKIIIPKEEPKPIHEQIIEHCGGKEKFKEITGLKPKQQTLEEVVEQELENHFFSNISEIKKAKYFINFGIELQQEQDKNKYSEEEVYNIVEQAIKNYGKNQLGFFDGGISNPIYYNLKKWFEQFKKK